MTYKKRKTSLGKYNISLQELNVSEVNFLFSAIKIWDVLSLTIIFDSNFIVILAAYKYAHGCYIIVVNTIVITVLAFMIYNRQNILINAFIFIQINL